MSSEHHCTQQTFIQAPVDSVWELLGEPDRHPEWWPEMVEVECADLRAGCRYRGVVKGPFGTQEHELVVEELAGCREVSIYCDGTGVRTRFVLTDAQGGTFVEGSFGIEPASAGMRMISAVVGRRYLRGWLERTLRNLKRAAEAGPSPNPRLPTQSA
jgi:Polyketide cyclase / dehydrase and lipid transport